MRLSRSTIVAPSTGAAPVPSISLPPVRIFMALPPIPARTDLSRGYAEKISGRRNWPVGFRRACRACLLRLLPFRIKCPLLINYPHSASLVAGRCAAEQRRGREKVKSVNPRTQLYRQERITNERRASRREERQSVCYPVQDPQQRLGAHSHGPHSHGPPWRIAPRCRSQARCSVAQRAV